jgi:lysophospholipase L1-like esterase
MKNPYPPVLFFILCLLLTSCSSPPVVPPLANDAVILAFGDSLTFGTGADSGQSYPAVLEDMIGRRVINAGIPGEVTAEGLQRLPEVLDQEKPDLLILCHGGNDLLRKLSETQMESNLKAMIRLARNRNISVVLVAVPAPSLSLAPPPLYADTAEEFSLPIEKDILPKILKKRELKADQIHPNAAGYHQMAQALAVLLQKSGALK